MYQYLTNLSKNFTPNNVLDLGAWNGFWTEKVKKIWPSAEYTCIEAGEKYRKHLDKIATHTHIAVLGNESKKVKMYLRKIKNRYREKITYTKGASIFNTISNEYEIRQMQTLSDIVGPDAQFDLIKQDVQGAEILIMQGSPKIFQRAKYIIQEVNTFRNNEHPDLPCVESMDNHMAQLGFDKSEEIASHDGQNQIDKIYWRG